MLWLLLGRGSHFVSLINLTSSPQGIRGGTQLYRPTLQKVESSKTEIGNNRANYVHETYEELNLQTDFSFDVITLRSMWSCTQVHV